MLSMAHLDLQQQGIQIGYSVTVRVAGQVAAGLSGNIIIRYKLVPMLVQLAE